MNGDKAGADIEESGILRSSITIGNALVSELGRRGKRGAYFNYETYSLLHQLNTVAELQAFLNQHGFPEVIAAADPVWVADGIEEAIAYRTPPVLCSSGGMIGGIYFFFWSLNRALRKQPLFPRRHSN